MRRALLAAVACTLLASAAGAEVVEAVVARVGDRIITRSQYQARLRVGFQEIEANTPAEQVAARKAEFQSTLLDEMLSELLIKDRADRLNLKVTPAELTEAVERLKAQYGIKTDEEFARSLQQSGMSRAEMEARLRDTLLTNKVFGRELRSRQEMTDKELREKYEREKEQYRVPERARLREIVLLIPDGADDPTLAQIATKAEEIAGTAKSGADFVKLVAEHSQSASKDQGGDLGVVARGELIASLDQAVFATQAGGIVGPLRSRSGFHIVKVEERLPSEIPGFESVRERLREDATEETFQRDYKAYIERLRKEAFVQINADLVPATL